jgi:hypothetical protein
VRFDGSVEGRSLRDWKWHDRWELVVGRQVNLLMVTGRGEDNQLRELSLRISNFLIKNREFNIRRAETAPTSNGQRAHMASFVLFIRA